MEKIYDEKICEEQCPHSLVNVWFMGLVLLEQRQMKLSEDTENRIYLLTDERFDMIQANRIVLEKEGEFMLHTRFAELHFQPILVKSAENVGGELLEDYIQIHGEVLSNFLE